MGRRVEHGHGKTMLNQTTRNVTETPGTAAPPVSEDHDRALLPHVQTARSRPSLRTVCRRPVARKASSERRGTYRGGLHKIVSAQRAATPGATDPTVRKAVRSIQSGGVVFTNTVRSRSRIMPAPRRRRKPDGVTTITHRVLVRALE
jgi:hypothetical protein